MRKIIELEGGFSKPLLMTTEDVMEVTAKILFHCWKDYLLNDVRSRCSSLW